MTENKLIVEVASIPIFLALHNAPFYDDLRLLYHEFISKKPCDIKIDVYLNDKPNNKEEGLFKVSFLNNKIMLSSTDFSGFLDITEKKGQVNIFSKWPLESLGNFLRNVYSMLIIKNGGLVLHASAVVRERKAYIFFGPSGSGKSTIAELSKTYYPVLSDDLVVIKRYNGIYKGFGTPYWGDMKTNNGINCSFEIAGFFKLVKSRKVYLKRLSRLHAMTEILSIPRISDDSQLVGQLLDMTNELVDNVPCYEMHFLPDNSFWRCIDERFCEKIPMPVS